MTETELKDALREENAEMPQHPELCWDMLEHIGSTDPELRDTLIYELLASWIEAGAYSQETMRRMMAICLDEGHIRFHLGARCDDSVFTRTFSSLIIAALLDRHLQEPYLTAEEITSVAGTLTECIGKEADIRGYVEGKGWAHAIAHISDAASALIHCPETSREQAAAIVHALTARIARSKESYLDGEERRAAVALKALCRRGFWTDDEWIGFIREVYANCRSGAPNDIARCRRVESVRRLYMALYFDLRSEGIGAVVADAIEQVMKVNWKRQRAASVRENR